MRRFRFSTGAILLTGMMILLLSVLFACANYYDILQGEQGAEVLSRFLPQNPYTETGEVRPAAHPSPGMTTEIPKTPDPEESAYERAASRPGFQPMEETTYTYTGMEDGVCLSKPANGYRIWTFPSGTKVQAVGTEGDWLVIRCMEGCYGYAESSQFEPGELYASAPGLLDLRALMPEALFPMTWCREENLTGRGLYPAIPFLEYDTALKLRSAYEEFLRRGYRLIIYDAYRPSSAQAAIYAQTGDTGYVLNPHESYSWHNVGKAVDISLLDIRTGEEMELPTSIYTFDSLSSRTMSEEWTDEAQANVNFMTGVMEDCGFTPIDTEWWHFEVPARADTDPNVHLDYSSVIYEPAS